MSMITCDDLSLLLELVIHGSKTIDQSERRPLGLRTRGLITYRRVAAYPHEILIRLAPKGDELVLKWLKEARAMEKVEE